MPVAPRVRRLQPVFRRPIGALFWLLLFPASFNVVQFRRKTDNPSKTTSGLRSGAGAPQIRKGRWFERNSRSRWDPAQPGVSQTLASMISRFLRYFSRQKNNVRGILNSPNFKNRSVGLVSRGGRGGGRGRFAAGRGRYTTEPKKSISELDRELEEYMKKSKHPKIIV